MDKYNQIVIIKGEVNDDVSRCYYDTEAHRTEVVYNNGRKYKYNCNNVCILRNPLRIDKDRFSFTNKEGHRFNNISKILQFADENNVFLRFFFKDGSFKSYNTSDLNITENTLYIPQVRSLFDYYKLVAEKTGLKSYDDTSILAKQYEKINFIGSDTVLYHFLNRSQPKHISICKPVIFPFGCNLSQISAVENALTDQISIIQGPPGTGKTQTILNIIANAVVNNKTVAVVSGNNSATNNVFEKLEKYGFSYISAQLGREDNKTLFINEKQTKYPDFSEYNYNECETSNLYNEIQSLKTEIRLLFEMQDEISLLTQELSDLKAEQFHFKNQCPENEPINIFRNKVELSSEKLIGFCVELERYASKGKRPALFYKFKKVLFDGIRNISIFKYDLRDIINTVQKSFYETKQNEINKRIEELKTHLESVNFNELISSFSEKSMLALKSKLSKKYSDGKRPIFKVDIFWQRPEQFLKEYPVILSTTYSIRNSLKDMIYDYVIVDESSQVDLATGILAMSCAKNIVVVGDKMQLPNVIKDDVRNKISHLSESFSIPEQYRFESNSLLSSVCKVFENAPQTLLKEHYRCHPKIINFCNKKFYNGQLVIMTKDNGEPDVLKVHITAEGNHARGHFNQRQIDEIKQVILPELNSDDVGIIAPYNAQTDMMSEEFETDIDISTVHKFQGREKKDIIISTVDNKITDFTDNPNLLNVAVSRAKNRLRIVVSDSDHSSTNIGDLINYIRYNNFEIVKSEINSVFDFLHKSKEEARKEFLKKHRKISEFDSENLMLAVIDDVLTDYSSLDVAAHIPLNMIISNTDKLTDEERTYVANHYSHVDFLIFRTTDKSPVMAIEVDGYKYHKKGTRQHERDEMKNTVLAKYGLQLMRFNTTESGEKERLTKELSIIIKCDE